MSRITAEFSFPFIVPERAEDKLPFEEWDGSTLYDGIPSKSPDEAIRVYGDGSLYCIKLTLQQAMELYWSVKRAEVSIDGDMPTDLGTGTVSGIDWSATLDPTLMTVLADNSLVTYDNGYLATNCPPQTYNDGTTDLLYYKPDTATSSLDERSLMVAPEYVAFVSGGDVVPVIADDVIVSAAPPLDNAANPPQAHLTYAGQKKNENNETASPPFSDNSRGDITATYLQHITSGPYPLDLIRVSYDEFWWRPVQVDYSYTVTGYSQYSQYISFIVYDNPTDDPGYPDVVATAPENLTLISGDPAGFATWSTPAAFLTPAGYWESFHDGDAGITSWSYGGIYIGSGYGSPATTTLITVTLSGEVTLTGNLFLKAAATGSYSYSMPPSVDPATATLSVTPNYDVAPLPISITATKWWGYDGMYNEDTGEMPV